MNMYSDITNHIVEAGTKHINGLAFRKCRSLIGVTLPEGLLSIGDAAFSYCSSLRQIQIPASVERIGVAAFCKSGLVSIQFLGIPKAIETGAFEGCGQLKEIAVPKGSKDVFVRKFGLPEDKVVEGKDQAKVVRQTEATAPEPPRARRSTRRPVQLSRFSYNAHCFYWSVGEEVDLRKVFSGHIALLGAATYEFRRKALFIFVKPATISTLKQEPIYELPASAFIFTFRYKDKYATRTPRIFVFACDDGRTARVYDEVTLVRINKASITVKSLLKD